MTETICICYLMTPLKSCLSNTVLPDEIIVIVDGPVRPAFFSKIQSFEKLDCVKVLWLPENVGLTQALNEGLKHVTSKYVFRADGDDINRPDRFALQLDMLSRGYSLCGGAICEKDMQGNLLAVKRCPSDHEDILKYARRRNPFNHMSVAYELKAAIAVGGYPDIYLKEDWGLWALLIEAGAKTINSQEIFVDATADINMYRRRGGVKNIISEYSIQKFLVSHLSKSIFSAFTDFFIKTLFFFTPAQMRGFIIRRYLRYSS